MKFMHQNYANMHVQTMPRGQGEQFGWKGAIAFDLSWHVDCKCHAYSDATSTIISV